MSLFFDYLTFTNTKIQLKTPVKRFINNDQFYFIPLRHKKQEIYIKTPKMVAPFGLNIYTNNDIKSYYYVLSFIDMDIDPNIENFLNFVHKAEQFCRTTVKNNIARWGYSQTFDSLHFKSSLKDSNGTPLLRLKITRNSTELYNIEGQLQPMDTVETLVTNQCHIISLLEMNNIWINSTGYGLTWKVIQMKIYPCTRPIGGVSLLTENIKIHDEPPPIPIPKYRPIGVNPMVNCFAMITAGNFNLKKTTVGEHKPKIDKSHQPMVSLNEILSIRKNLRNNKQRESTEI